MFYKAVTTQDVTKLINLTSFYYTQDISFLCDCTWYFGTFHM